MSDEVKLQLLVYAKALPVRSLIPVPIFTVKVVFWLRLLLGLKITTLSLIVISPLTLLLPLSITLILSETVPGSIALSKIIVIRSDNETLVLSLAGRHISARKEL